MSVPRRIATAVVVTLIALSPLALAEGKTLGETAASAQADLDASLAELSALRKQIAAEKLPLSKELSDLETRLVKVRAEYQDAGRLFDTRNLDINTLQTELKGVQDQSSYLSTLLDEYVRNFESRVHIAELQRYRETVQAAREAPENGNLTPAEVFELQVDAVDASLDRLVGLLGGDRFDGTAVAEDGRVRDVTFMLLGPVAAYRLDDGSDAGLAEQRLGSLEPKMVGFDDPRDTALTSSLIATGQGELPLDPTLGNAQKIEQTQESILSHVQKGGPVMIPILLLAACALVVAVAKWVQLTRVRMPRRRKVDALLDAVRRGDRSAASASVKKLSGPVGEMLAAGVDHLNEPKQLIEEVMFEKMLDTRLRLQSWLSFVAVSAASAPLLGLLGTVTGIINTFKLITVYGTGDAKTLSSGISEALITTEFGLIVAIPSLLLHAFLSRKAKRFVDGMEKTAVSLLNRISMNGEPVVVIDAGSTKSSLPQPPTEAVAEA